MHVRLTHDIWHETKTKQKYIIVTLMRHSININGIEYHKLRCVKSNIFWKYNIKLTQNWNRDQIKPKQLLHVPKMYLSPFT